MIGFAMVLRTQTRCTDPGRRGARAVRALAALASLVVLLVAAPSAFAAQERMPVTGIGADGCDWSGGACAVANLDE
jgi:hypothetical protein